MGGPDPVLLNGAVVLHPDGADDLGRCLEGLFEQSSHVEVFGKQEDVRHKILGSFGKGERGSQLLVFEDSGPEDVPQLMDRERFPQDHFVERLRHPSEQDFVAAH